MVVYHDNSGNEHSFEVPGWENNISDIKARLADAENGCSAVGYIFVERPYRDLSNAPREITVVDLHSRDGNFRMFQEFAGSIEDQALLGELIKERIGASWSDWNPVDVQVMRRTVPEKPAVALEEGVFHLVYTVHSTEADFELIEPDLNQAAKASPRLVLVLEDVLTIEHVCKYLDPSSRDVPPDLLFDPATVRRNREKLAAAYAAAVQEMNEGYGAWNALPPAQRRGAWSYVKPFHRRLLDWAVDHGVELIPEETSLEAWLWRASATVVGRRVDRAAARGDAATMWMENRKLWEIMTRMTQLRDADVHAQVARLLRVERRGYHVLYVVGVGHAIDEELLVNDLEAIVYEKRSPLPVSDQLVAALAGNALEGQPEAFRDRLETLAFLGDRLDRLQLRTRSTGDVAPLIAAIEQTAAARGFTLRRIVDDIVSIPAFQEAAGTVDEGNLGTFVAWAFIKHMVSDEYVSRAEVDRCLNVHLGSTN
jgi:hypothetical protein